jgi:hypothetical protein
MAKKAYGLEEKFLGEMVYDFNKLKVFLIDLGWDIHQISELCFIKRKHCSYYQTIEVCKKELKLYSKPCSKNRIKIVATNPTREKELILLVPPYPPEGNGCILVSEFEKHFGVNQKLDECMYGYTFLKQKALGRFFS